MTMLVALGFVLAATAQNRVITGTLKDESGSHLGNVSVIVKGTASGTSSDASGRFSLALPANAKTLVISGIGYASQEISIGSKLSFDILMKVASVSMEDVVVVGYGTQQKKAFTGSASRIETKEFATLVTPSVDKQLAGI